MRDFSDGAPPGLQGKSLETSCGDWRLKGHAGGRHRYHYNGGRHRYRYHYNSFIHSFVQAPKCPPTAKTSTAKAWGKDVVRVGGMQDAVFRPGEAAQGCKLVRVDHDVTPAASIVTIKAPRRPRSRQPCARSGPQQCCTSSACSACHQPPSKEASMPTHCYARLEDRTAPSHPCQCHDYARRTRAPRLRTPPPLSLIHI